MVKEDMAEVEVTEKDTVDRNLSPIDLFRGACAVKGNVQVAGHVKRIDNGAAFNA